MGYFIFSGFVPRREVNFRMDDGPSRSPQARESRFDRAVHTAQDYYYS
jgi:hypothetical protein